MTRLLLILASFLILVTVLPLVRTDAWWVRICDFPRAQIATLGLFTLVGLLVQWKALGSAGYVTTVLLALGVLLQAAQMFPYTPLAAEQVKPSEHAHPDTRVSVFIANVLMTNRNAEDLLALVRQNDPDIVFFVETDAWWEQALRDLDGTYPYRVKQPQDNTYGMLLYARLKLTDTQVRFLVEDDVPSVKTTVVLPSGDPVTLYGLHPRPPRPDKKQDTTTRDAELVMVGKEIEGDGRPVIVIGDLNDVAWSHTTRLFQRLSGLLDPRRGRGLFSTFHAHYPFLRYPLDHVFHTDHFRLAAIERLPSFGSDHFPIYAALHFEPSGAVQQEAPEADHEDVEEADTMIQKAVEQTP